MEKVRIYIISYDIVNQTVVFVYCRSAFVLSY